jgi:hypothetical protein
MSILAQILTDITTAITTLVTLTTEEMVLHCYTVPYLSS